MPTLYEIFTGRWGAEKDARIAELETSNETWQTHVKNRDVRITELETENTSLSQTAATWEGKYDDVMELKRQRDADVERLEAELKPFRDYVDVEVEAPPAGNGANGAVA